MATATLERVGMEDVAVIQPVLSGNRAESISFETFLERLSKFNKNGDKTQEECQEAVGIENKGTWNQKIAKARAFGRGIIEAAAKENPPRVIELPRYLSFKSEGGQGPGRVKGSTYIDALRKFGMGLPESDDNRDDDSDKNGHKNAATATKQVARKR